MTEDPSALDHVRRADLPWRVADLTECGRRVTDVAQLITRDELAARLARHGRKRSAMLTCMTCFETAGRYRAFAVDPVDALRREVNDYRQDERLTAELRALAALVQAHREEFDGFVTGLGETVSLAAARAGRRGRR